MTTDPGRRRDRLVRVVVTVTALVAVAVVVVAAVRDEGAPRDWALLAGFALALVAAELRPIHLVHRDGSEALQVEEAFFVPMAFLLAPVDVLLTVVLAVGLASLTWRRGALKAVFNTAMMTACVGAGLGLAHGIGLDRPLGPRTLVAAVAGCLLLSVLSALWVSVVISVAQGVPVRAVLTDGVAARVAMSLGSLSLGVLVAVAAERGAAVLVAAAVPVIVLQFAYDGALRQWRERRQAEALYAAAGRIRESSTSAQVEAELVAAARDLLEAGSTRLVPTAEPPPPGALRARLDEETAVEVADRATGGTWSKDDESRLLALVGVASGALGQALAHEQMRAITQSLGEGVLALDETGVITFANRAAESLLGWAPGGLVGKDISGAVDPASRGSAAAAGWVHLPRLRAGETVRLDEHVVTRADGRPLDVALTASPVVREGGVAGTVVVFRDVAERKALEQRLMHQAFHDQLTGLPNRALFLDRLEHARARQADTTQAVLFVDVDRFKLINDSLGHRAGDDVLCTVGSRLVGAVRAGDTVARFGGDEFTILLEGLSGRGEATATAERILRALAVPVRAGDRDVVVSASIGIAVTEPGNGPNDLLAAADIAMYEAKSAGRDCYAFASADADDVARARLDLEMELRRAIEHGELVLEYQPVVRTHGEVLHGFEALVRWRHPRLGMLPPSQFMPLAEESGLVLPLGEWVLDEACRAAKEWQRRLPATHAVMAVNLSARQFQQPDLCERVVRALTRTGLDPSRLTLEITETVLMEDTARTVETLRRLRQVGVRLAIDDFGTGYSSLSYLKRFPVDVVKIDKSFVDGLATGSVDREIVAAVIRLASAVGMSTVAEGVETPEQLDQLRLLGCSMVQGFLVARPEPLRELQQRLGEAAAVGLPVPRAPWSGQTVTAPTAPILLPQ